MSERLWQHEETGRMVWKNLSPGLRWYEVPTMHEDELPPMTDAEYSAWYENSTVPGGVGCRIGPRVGGEGAE